MSVAHQAPHFSVFFPLELAAALGSDDTEMSECRLQRDGIAVETRKGRREKIWSPKERLVVED